MREWTEKERWRDPTDREDYIGTYFYGSYFYGTDEEECEFYDDDEDEQEEGETVLQALARRAVDMEAGRAHPHQARLPEQFHGPALVHGTGQGSRRSGGPGPSYPEATRVVSRGAQHPSAGHSYPEYAPAAGLL